ncbi:MAG TPA: hypothetical protein VH915_02625 [Pedococcus sp.]
MSKPTPRPLRYAATLALAACLPLSLAACGTDEPATPGLSPSTTTSPSSTTSPTSSPTTSATSSPATTPTTPPPAAQSPKGRRIAITVKGKKVTPAPRTVDLAVGETLTLVVTSDHDDEIHAHGFEVKGRLRAGVPSTITVKGTDPGLYEVETHEPPLRLLMIAVR